MQDVTRLDFNLPPPGYLAGRADGAYLGMDAAQSRATAWTHHKARHDPPGMRTRPWGVGGWVFCCALVVERTPGSRAVMVDDDGNPYASEAVARAAAWAWYERRLALAERLKSAVLVASETFRGRPLRTVIPASEARHFDECEVSPLDIWPRILTWTDEEVAEVERWLADSTAEMPAVLSGKTAA